MAKQSWLVKQEPDAYAWAQLVAEERTAWTGIRNFQARNYLRAMQRGDWVCYYHSGAEKRVVGLARVEREAYPDPSATEGDWSCVDLAAVRAFKFPVTLAQIKGDPLLGTMALLRQTRLSVTPVTPEQFARLLELGQTILPSVRRS